MSGNNRVIKLLLVEDNDFDAHLISNLLSSKKRNDYELSRAKTLSECLDLLALEFFSTVVLDLNLSDSKGLDTFNKLRERHPSLPIIVLTGMDDEELAVTCLQFGAQDYVYKEDMKTQLSRSIRYALERQKSIDLYLEIQGRLNSIINHTTDGILIVNNSGHILFANPMAEKIWGKSSSNLAGEKIDASFETMRSLLISISRDDGEERLLELVWESFDWEDESCWLVSARDVTENQRIRHQLRESEARYRLLAENSSDMIAIQDMNGCFKYVSPACRRILGRDPNDLIETLPLDLYHPDDLSIVDKALSMGQNSEDSYTCSYRLRHKSGKYIWCEASSRLLDSGESNDGAPDDIVTILRDINQRKLDERVFALLKSTVENSSEIIFIFDIEGKSVFHNHKFLAEFGITVDELNDLGGPTAMFSMQSVLKGFMGSDSDLSPWRGIVEVKTNDDKITKLKLVLEPALGSLGDIIGFVGRVCLGEELEDSKVQTVKPASRVSAELVRRSLFNYHFEYEIDENEKPILRNINDRFKELADWPVSFESFEEWKRVIAPEDWNGFNELFLSLSTGEKRRGEVHFRLEFPSGESRAFCCVAGTSGAADQIDLITGVLIELDAENAKRSLPSTSQNQLNDISRYSPWGEILLCDSLVTYANPAICELLKISEEAIAGSSMEQFVDKKDLSSFRENYRTFINRQMPEASIHCKMRDYNGKEFSAKIIFSRVSEKSDQIIAVFLQDDSGRMGLKANINRLNRIVNLLKSIHHLLLTNKDRRKVTQMICKRMTKIGAYHDTWMIVSDDTGKPVYSAQSGLDMEFFASNKALEAGSWPNCAREVFKQNAPLALKDSANLCDNCSLGVCRTEHHKLILRLNYKNFDYGVMGIVLNGKFEDYPHNEIDILHSLADDVGCAFFNMELAEKEKNARKTVLQSQQKLGQLSNTSVKTLSKAEVLSQKILANFIAVLDSTQKNLAVAKMYLEPEMDLFDILANAESAVVNGLELAEQLIKSPDSNSKKSAQTVTKKIRKLKKYRVLLVDSDETQLDFMEKTILNKLDLEVFKTDSGDAAVELLRKDKAMDLIVLSVQLPGTGGLETAEIIKSLPDYSYVPIVFLADSDPQKESLDKYLAIRESDYITKPIDKDEFIHRVKIYLKFVDYRRNFHSIVEKSENGILILDEKNVIQFSNSTAEHQLQQSHPSLIGSKFSLNLNKKVPNEIDIIRKNSLSGIGEIRIADTEWANEKARLVTITDISLRKKYEMENLKAKEILEEAYRVKSEFLANISHEIRTPLNSILGFSDLLLETQLNSKQFEKLQLISESANTLLVLLNDIIDFSKLEIGDLESYNEAFEPKNLVRKIALSVTPLLKNKNVEINYEFSSEVPEAVIGDEIRIGQVLRNLLNNAAKFTKEGEICVSIEKKVESEHEVSLLFTVVDTGIGIPEEQVEQIFEAFKQVDGSITREFGGGGLGLAISQKIVNFFNGEISVESNLGEGSVFSFWIPFKKYLGD